MARHARIGGIQQLLLLLAACCAPAISAIWAEEPAAIPPHLEAAGELVRHVLPADSSYQHKHGVVHWKGSDHATLYECHTDCSGLLNHLFEHCYAMHGKDLKHWLGTERPTAATYHDAIVAQNGFLRIAQPAKIRPGDIMAVKHAPGSGNTGHILIVTHAPLRRAPTAPVVQETDQWEVAIIDSTASGHGKGDSRLRPDGTFNGGIGVGVLRLYANQHGELAGHTWSRSHGSTYRSQADRHLVIGRLASDKMAKLSNGK
jgi:hypothetical protein